MAGNAASGWSLRRNAREIAALSDSAATLRTIAHASTARLDTVTRASLALVADTAALNRALRDARRTAAALLANARAASSVAADPAVGDTTLRAVIRGLVADAERAAASWARTDSAATARIRALEGQLIAQAEAGARALADAERAWEARLAQAVAAERSRHPTRAERLRTGVIVAGGAWLLGKLDTP